MEPASIKNLLEVGYFLYQIQRERIDQPLGHEIELILNTLLEAVGIIKKRGSFQFIVNTDYYEEWMISFFRYCRGELTQEQFIEHVWGSIPVNVNQAVGGHVVDAPDKQCIINALFNLKYSIQMNREQSGDRTQDLDLLRAEKKILAIILDELGKKSML